MVCPYCNGNSLPSSAVCTHCGVILKLAHQSRKKLKPIPWRRIFGTAIGYIALAAILGSTGYVVARIVNKGVRDMDPVFTAVGVSAGLLLMFFLSGGRVVYAKWRLNRRRAIIHAEIQKITREREKKIEALLKPEEDGEKKELDPCTRMENATVNLLQGRIEEGLHQLEQVYNLGAGARHDFLNNCGVAFARRGQLQLSIDRFQQAMQSHPDSVEPHLNLMYSAFKTGDVDSVTKALPDKDLSMALEAEKPGFANRIGLSYIVAGRSIEGERMIQRVLKSGDRFQQADAHNDLGIARAHERRYRDAMNEFSQALHFDPGHGPAMANIGVVYYVQRRYNEAARQFEDAVTVDPHNGLAHNHLGAAYLHLGMVNEGIRQFRDARVHESHLFEPNYNLGRVYVQHGILDQAEQHLVRAYEINPYSWRALLVQAVLLFKQNQIERAAAVYRQANQIRPNETMVLNGLGLCATLQGDYEAAQEYFDSALGIRANDVGLLTNTAWNHLLRADVASATYLLEQAVQLDLRAPVANLDMGLCQMEMGAHDAAGQYFQRAVHSDPGLNSVWYDMGCNYIAHKLPDRAIEAWEKAKKADAGNADLFTNLGVGYYKKEQFEKAMTEFRRVLHLRQERAEDYANIGLAMARLKRHKEAIEQFELGLRVDPRNAMLHSNLGLACYFANRIEDAMREWQIVTQINKQYAQMRAKKQQSEYDDSSIDYVPLFIAERVEHTEPGMPDYSVPYVPGYQTARWELIIESDEVRRLGFLHEQSDLTERQIRASKV